MHDAGHVRATNFEHGSSLSSYSYSPYPGPGHERRRDLSKIYPGVAFGVVRFGTVSG